MSEVKRKRVQVSLMIDEADLQEHVYALRESKILRKLIMSFLDSHMKDPSHVENMLINGIQKDSDALSSNLEFFKLYLAEYNNPDSFIKQNGVSFEEVKTNFENGVPAGGVDSSGGSLEDRIGGLETMLSSLMDMVSGGNVVVSKPTEVVKPVSKVTNEVTEEKPVVDAKPEVIVEEDVTIPSVIVEDDFEIPSMVIEEDKSLVVEEKPVESTKEVKSDAVLDELNSLVTGLL